ncbi:MAG: ABC transporter ATP-binding protein [Spirochaetia bacterium]|nr:ABC transporter ATP-binding protein [Spirochaetia bacterium]HNV18211.1 ABC transporter ATP-binding protein [Rectinema sp.]HPV58082.1 ABC transporter ATP-binding protein [Rectinema sp.]
MDEYFDAEPVTKGYDAQIARRILLYLKPYRLYAIIAILALAIATAGELISPTIIKRAIDDVVVRDWYGIDPSAKYILPKDEGSLEVRIGGRIYVRASRLAGLTMAERNRLFEQGLLDNEASYVFPLDPMREEKISIAERISKVELSDNWGVIPSSVLRTLRSEDAAILRAADDKALLRFGLILLIVLLIVLGATFAMTWFTNQISTLIMKDMRLELFHHVIEQSLSYLSRQPVGRLVTRLTSDIEVISQFFSDVLSAFIKDASIMIGSLIVLFLLSWKLAFVVLATMPLVFIASAVARIKARDAFRNQRYWTSKVNSFLSEHISGIDIVKLFVQENKVSEGFGKNNKQLLKANIAEMYVYATFRPFVDFMATLTTVLAIFFGAMLFLRMQISIGTLIAFISLISMFYSPIKDLSEKYILLQSAMASGERIFGLLDQDERLPDQLPEFVGKPFPRTIRGHIEFSHVWFAYKNEEWVLKDVSFIVNPGEKVAIVGYTGAGKSTVANLLARFWDIQEGSILIDGVSIGQFPLKQIRRLIQPVPQDVFLFQGTIRENISLGLDLSQEKLEEAAKAVYAHDFIISLPQGYDTPLAEGGLNLSLGQRQLISFARVLAHEPSVIILDEATSSIDTETEKLLQRGIEGLLKGHTSIVIAHRLSTIRNANRIIVLGQGRVVEIGTHDELIALKGLYWNLYRLQNKEAE